MTDFEMIMIMLGILTLLIGSWSLLIALLNFLESRNSKRK